MDPLRQQINIALVGAVSAGKSTLTNALFVEQFSDMRIRRTTALPQVYHTVADEAVEDLSKIREMNRERNESIMAITANGGTLKIEDVKEVNYCVPPVFGMLEGVLKKDVFLTIHDLPGLNDAKTKDVYYQYVAKTFHSFDVVLFVVDIFSALNTSDETDMLQLILTNMTENRTKYGINTKLIVVANKCDDMEIVDGVAVPLDEELIEMADQIKTITRAMQKEIYPDADVDFVVISCENSYVYRMFGRNSSDGLDPKYLNKIGSTEYGKSKWNRQKPEKKKKLLAKIFKEFDYSESMALTGFAQFDKCLADALTPPKQHQYLLNHIKYQLSQIPTEKKVNIGAELDLLHRIRAELGCINLKFNKKVVCSIFVDYFEGFMASYMAYWQELISPGYVVDSAKIATISAFKYVMDHAKKRFGSLMDFDEPINKANAKMCTYAVQRVNDLTIPWEGLVKWLRFLNEANFEEFDAVLHGTMKNLINYKFIEFSIGPIAEACLIDNLKILQSMFRLDSACMVGIVASNIGYQQKAGVSKTGNGKGYKDYYIPFQSSHLQTLYDLSDNKWIKQTKYESLFYRIQVIPKYAHGGSECKLIKATHESEVASWFENAASDHIRISNSCKPTLVKFLIQNIEEDLEEDHKKGISVFRETLPKFLTRGEAEAKSDVEEEEPKPSKRQVRRDNVVPAKTKAKPRKRAPAVSAAADFSDESETEEESEDLDADLSD